MTNFLDDLIMLLSTDWFKPYWTALAIDLDDSKKELVQKGCREIVSRIVGSVPEYWLISFSDERREETRSMFESLAKLSGQPDSLLQALMQWLELSDEDLKAGCLFYSLTEDLSDDSNEQCLLLDTATRSIVLAAQQKLPTIDFDFGELCIRSKSTWDRYIRQLTPSAPKFLSDSVLTFLQAGTFKSLWLSLRDELTPAQRDELARWYRGAAKSLVRRDIAPTYIGEGISSASN
ncbi:MAG TPA: hypothetical protein VNW97_10150 [Candidatus Saccharimonadales bacterium]|jgi:hypothetical protein|nr:hypothetical protein [Candidatus Saccharimonadales bacterium]